MEDAGEFLAQLQDKGVMRRVVEEASEGFCEVFEEVEERVLDAAGEEGEEEVREVWPRTSGEIRVLLS